MTKSHENRLPVCMITAGNIKKYRLANGWTMTDLATQTNVRWQTIQNYEQGKNRLCTSRLMDISRALGVSPMDLLPEVDWMTQTNLLGQNNGGLNHG